MSCWDNCNQVVAWVGDKDLKGEKGRKMEVHLDCQKGIRRDRREERWRYSWSVKRKLKKRLFDNY